ncbi:sodium/proton-potassium antiporter GerN, CPA2 family [Hathewaya proteolytica DSM 3090]|uniref:Sodium/proton-potassium antiporter GerN, CPA2 family n=1 Tax=Hathewaya proteolytica DSM 3090 TaxID=1121331 RepID=A0A1M6TAC5_9CLOT|nr:cation:proton antiporter [Hathewaya proteolytica]SHK53950.1 sodium/proton-potassium antiporter GerN, CPA2 family [Hathewaya proteolytica DSM 3090]
MLSTHFLLDLAIILLSTKILGIGSRKIKMPQVVGALIAGLILGPSILNIVHESDFIVKMSELGVILLMFTAGLNTDIKELKKCGKASLVIALIGVIVPLIGGFLVASLFNPTGAFDIYSKTFLKNMFIGVILTATSVSITVETLMELGKLKTKSGTSIMGAAIIDDILGIILLTIITSMAEGSVNILNLLLTLTIFFALCFAGGYLFRKLFNAYCKRHGRKQRVSIYAFAFCLIMAFIAENFFGVADITGAYIAGVIISNTVQYEYIREKVDILSALLFSPIFFASIGIKTSVSGMNSTIVWFTVLLLLVAILTKIVGCGIGAKLCHYTGPESLRIGVGMISRGEVALIVANKGVPLGLMDPNYFGAVIIVVIVTTLITPILLKLSYSRAFKDVRENEEKAKAMEKEKVANV